MKKCFSTVVFTVHLAITKFISANTKIKGLKLDKWSIQNSKTLTYAKSDKDRRKVWIFWPSKVHNPKGKHQTPNWNYLNISRLLESYLKLTNNVEEIADEKSNGQSKWEQVLLPFPTCLEEIVFWKSLIWFNCYRYRVFVTHHVPVEVSKVKDHREELRCAL